MSKMNSDTENHCPMCGSETTPTLEPQGSTNYRRCYSDECPLYTFDASSLAQSPADGGTGVQHVSFTEDTAEQYREAELRQHALAALEQAMENVETDFEGENQLTVTVTQQ